MTVIIIILAGLALFGAGAGAWFKYLERREKPHR